MRTDDLIDDVARAMTAVDGRPDVRARVLAAIGKEPGERRFAWMVPAAVASAAACAALVWFLMPAAPVAPAIETTIAEHVLPAPAPAPVGNAAEGLPVSSSVATRTPIVARAIATTPASAAPAWSPSPLAEIPSLPPLAGPPPIVIEPIAWSEITIAPVDVRPIEVKALVIEPLEVTRLDGV